ncbi:MAG: DNA-3-methyladenine glycosylase I [Alkalibacterium gilvum]|uniref:DNA-3-methyladenine glycosylase I n=1 Tax=Alkalibacterium gilvum TaxID=1130080 RepID=A0A1H6TSQ5_9LACT|nr:MULTISPECIES: DNA-3-methyladenine glycosylase I [Alkalibacterium]MDN6293268.1 DNA-3-methyladenine glycosylase I [Alkalibacterium sp.]MDN6295030.1 DNA-3-methyladenine glycosylase I [Alkalibacterium sp.]MDN6397529.1 DNA-3-methyladenine glycosylase I [Alkalibacterium sp.]MDN6728742.1 DNA-3-methyladenine glycosylase I [Alkalibacterium sp.]SEI78732.1 DNA-3-methyladenine glycosylase I [Alkalibacterium gilvum]
MTNRCKWVTDNQKYKDYHDKEWGRPLYDDKQLFELLCLEGAQAGLSWLTVLKKRENYREAFDNFDPQKISNYNEEKIQKLLKNENIIRNKLKIRSVVTNAQAYLEILESGQTFSDYLWQFVDGEPIQNARIKNSDIPSQTERSQRMSKQLKKDGFKFVGPTICYAFMQASGMVNDHVTDCFCYEEVKEENLSQ